MITSHTRVTGWALVEVLSRIKTGLGSGTSLLAPQFNSFYVASQAIGDQEAAILVFEPMP